MLHALEAQSFLRKLKFKFNRRLVEQHKPHFSATLREMLCTCDLIVQLAGLVLI